MSHLRRISSVSRAGALFSVLFAISSSPGARAASDAIPSGAYAVDPAHTQVVFHVMHLGFTKFTGIFPNAHGQLFINTKEPSNSHVEISLPIKDVETTNKTLNSELKNANWFNASKFAEATFVSTHVVRLDDKRLSIDGLLTLNGVTKPLTLSAKLMGTGVNPLNHRYTVGFEAMGQIHRSAFGVKAYIPLVADDVTLHIAGAFEKAD